MSVIPDAHAVVAGRQNDQEGQPPIHQARRYGRRAAVALTVLIGGTIGCYILLGFALHALFAG